MDGGWRMAKMEELERRAKMPQGCTWYLGSDFPFLAFLAMQCACPSVRSTSARGTYCSDVVGDGYLGTEYISKVRT